MHSSPKVLPQHFNQVEVFDWNIVALILFHPFCCRNAWDHCPVIIQFQTRSNCQTDNLIFDSIILWYTEEFMVDSRTTRCLGPVAAKQAWIIIPQLCLTVDTNMLFVHFPNVVLCIMFSISTMIILAQGRCSRSLAVSLDATGFRLATILSLFGLFLTVLPWTHANWGLWLSLRCNSWVFWQFLWALHCLTSRWIGTSTPGNTGNYLKCFQL